MEYRFKLTPRRAALAVCCAVAMSALLLALGFMLGLRSAALSVPTAVSSAALTAASAPR
jgi:hypothetical protein